MAYVEEKLVVLGFHIKLTVSTKEKFTKIPLKGYLTSHHWTNTKIWKRDTPSLKEESDPVRKSRSQINYELDITFHQKL